jgi:hypothetical protein
MKKLLLLSALILTSIAFGQGLHLDSAAYAEMDKWEPESFGYTTSGLPSRISYRRYTPFVGDQGQVSTCVGWALAHGQLTTQQNLLMGITNRNQKSWRAMDAHFIYGMIRDLNDTWCQQGTFMPKAMDVLSTYGCKPSVWEPWLSCNSSAVIEDFTLATAAPYRIGQWYALRMDANAVDAVKTALNSKHIVSVGMSLTESFMSGSTRNSGKWSPKTYEGKLGGHAMCIVGYDDYKYGGAFEILNSYGDGFGDNGYVWVSYRDFTAHMDQAFIFDTPGYSKGGCMYGDCRNSFSIYKTSDGGMYEGVVSNSYPDVYGMYVFPNGGMYVGGWKNGRKHGYGLLYDIQTGAYYNVAFSNDVLTNSAQIQGFASEEDAENIKKVYEQLSGVVPGELLDENSDEYEQLEENYEVPMEPIQPDLDYQEPTNNSNEDAPDNSETAPSAPENADPSCEHECKKCKKKRLKREKKK